MILMIENLKQRFEDLVDSESITSGQGLPQKQHQQSNSSEPSSSSQCQGQETSIESTLSGRMQTADLESGDHCQSTEYKIVERLCEIFPHLDHIGLHLKVNHYLGERRIKVKGSEKNIDVALAVNEVSEEIFNAETDSNGLPKIGQNRPQKYMLNGPEEGKYHNFEEEHHHHFYVAAYQFYKMLQRKSMSIASIEYLVNEKTLETFDSKKKFFEENKRGLNTEGKVKELLLFHGTDTANVDSILENNFAIDAVPTHKRKAMAYGRGIYMSEHPETALIYGNKLLLCRVLPGEVERLERNQSSNRGQMSSTHDSKEVSSGSFLRNKGVIHVIKDETQILPYCILHLNGGHYNGKTPQLHGTAEPKTLSTNLNLKELIGPNLPGSPNVPRGPNVPAGSYVPAGPNLPGRPNVSRGPTNLSSAVGGDYEKAPGLHGARGPNGETAVWTNRSFRTWQITNPQTEPTPLTEILGRPNSPRRLRAPTSSFSAAATKSPYPLSEIWQNLQTESSDLGFLQHQQQQSNPSAVCSSSRPQGEVSSLFVPMQTDLVGEISVHLQSTEYKIVQRLGEIFPHLNQWKIHLKVNHYLDKMKSREKNIDVALAVNEISEAIFNAMTDLDPIRMDLASIRNNLLTGIDEEYNVPNKAAVVKVIEQLESFEISREEL